MTYLYLIFAIILEVCGTTSMKLSQGFTKPFPSFLIFVFYGISFTLLTMVLKRMDVSIAYAIWSGLGTALIAIMGITYFNEPVTFMKLVSLSLVIIGVFGLNLSSGAY
jgi:small multidrug resistance pump